MLRCNYNKAQKVLLLSVYIIYGRRAYYGPICQRGLLPDFIAIKLTPLADVCSYFLHQNLNPSVYVTASIVLTLEDDIYSGADRGGGIPALASPFRHTFLSSFFGFLKRFQSCTTKFMYTNFNCQPPHPASSRLRTCDTRSSILPKLVSYKAVNSYTCMPKNIFLVLFIYGVGKDLNFVQHLWSKVGHEDCIKLLIGCLEGQRSC